MQKSLDSLFSDQKLRNIVQRSSHFCNIVFRLSRMQNPCAKAFSPRLYRMRAACAQSQRCSAISTNRAASVHHQHSSTAFARSHRVCYPCLSRSRLNQANDSSLCCQIRPRQITSVMAHIDYFSADFNLSDGTLRTCHAPLTIHSFP